MASLPHTEPASSAAGPTNTDASTLQYHRTLACVRCQRRKVKCNRGSPCSNCVRSKSHCIPATPAPIQRKRRANQALNARLARCEELLEKYTSKGIEAAQIQHAASPSSPSQSFTAPPPISKWTTTDGKLVEEDDGKITFMDNHLLKLVHDELRAMHEIVNTEDSNDDSPRATDVSDDNSDLVLGGDSPQISTECLWPSPAVVFRLWQIYLERVDPLTKIIHVPTFQPFVVQATAGPQGLTDQITALLLAMFLMAVVSLSESECEDILGDGKAAAMNRLSSGVRQTLRRIGILRNNDLAVLQTLVLYLISLQGRYNRHAAWILNGIVIRIAQKMGLHQDGELLGLEPFESEMRRRVWWQILAIDTKFALFSGLGHSLLPRDWQVKMPRNLNDVDIFPSSTQHFADREGPTEMIFCLVQCEITRFLVETPGLEPVRMMSDLNGSGYRSQELDDARDQKIKYYRKHFDLLEQRLHTLIETRCNPDHGQIHRMALQVMTTLVKQKRELINGLGYQIEPNRDTANGGDNAFNSAVAIIEHAHALYMSTENSGFLWYVLLNVQLDVVLYVVIQLGYRIEGPSIQRVWDQVEILYRFHQALFDLTNPTFLRLARYVIRAWTRRYDMLSRQGQPLEKPEYIEKLQKALGYDTCDTTVLSHPDGTGILGEANLESESRLAGNLAAGGPSASSIENAMDTQDMDWSFLETIARGQVAPSGLSFMGYGAGPWTEW